MASSIARSLFVAQQKHTTRLICASFINVRKLNNKKPNLFCIPNHLMCMILNKCSIFCFIIVSYSKFQSQRYYSFVSTLSTNEKSPQKFTRCHEVSSEYWKFVDRLKPPAVVPSPTNTENFLSGWTPQPGILKCLFFLFRAKC